MLIDAYDELPLFDVLPILDAQNTQFILKVKVYRPLVCDIDILKHSIGNCVAAL